MNEDKTTKAKRVAGGVPIETASPTGQEELEQYVAAEELPNGEHHDTSHRDPHWQDQKPLEPPQPLNPKRTRNSQGKAEPTSGE